MKQKEMHNVNKLFYKFKNREILCENLDSKKKTQKKKSVFS